VRWPHPPKSLTPCRGKPKSPRSSSSTRKEDHGPVGDEWFHEHADFYIPEPYAPLGAHGPVLLRKWSNLSLHKGGRAS
jgi:hypothetical protein